MGSRRTYPEFCETVSSFPDSLSGSPIEDPFRAQRPDKYPSADNSNRLFEAQVMSRMRLVFFPGCSTSEGGSGNCHESRLGDQSGSPAVDNSIAELTFKVRCKVSSTTISCLSHQPPSYSEVRVRMDSSKASLLFFCEPSFGTSSRCHGVH